MKNKNSQPLPDQNKKVVIIEDDNELAQLLCRRLEYHHFTVLCAATGEDGLDAVHTMAPDIVILDLQLPMLQGESVCKMLREDESTERIPIIMLTAKCTDVDRVVGKVIGANAYITKPFDFDNLLNVLLQLVEKPRI